MAEKRFDFLVIGSGIAGLTFALEAARFGRVAVLTKREAWDTNTWMAQGGIAAVFGDDDSFERHTRDTLEAGAGLCHPQVVASTVAEGPAAIATLESYGVSFSRREENGYDLGREGGHSQRRILHIGDGTGRAIEERLLDRVVAEPRIELFEHHCAIDFVTTSKLEGRPPARGETRVLGAYVLDALRHEIVTFAAPRVFLASGGCGKVYRYTSNPDIASGDGIAMAYRAGARLANLEFVQFHPTCLYHPRERRFLISEAVRGEGAVLRSLDGRAFAEAVHPLGSLAPRDIVARAIDSEMKASGANHVLLDLSAIPAERIKRRFPLIYGSTLALGIDITREPIPVVPAAHYMCGGVVTGADGATDLVNLYAGGECACTGLHGANRLASNSLLESVVFARRAAQASAASPADERGSATQWPAIPPWDPGQASLAKESILVNAHWTMIRATMWDFVGIVRRDQRLELARRYLRFFRESVESYYWDFILDSDLIELRNLSLLAELIVASASARRESRGLHYNADRPEPAAGAPRHSCADPATGNVALVETEELPFGKSPQAHVASAPRQEAARDR